TDYQVDEKMKSATLTEQGITRVEKILKVDNLYEKDFESIHHIENALRARSLYLRDKDYVVKDGEVTIVDEFTGRLMFGRRWSDGLHQAVEAKEGVVIQQESKTLATISFQNYFRMYDVLSGMTGTAATEAEEFQKIYKLDVLVVPTHKDMARTDHADAIYKTLRGKYGAVVTEIEQRHKNGQPVLVGTTSIEKNEILSDFLRSKKIPHNTLNAKNHEKEAMILSEAGKPGNVTVATNMAGRGVDIVLGGSFPDRRQDQTDEEYKNSKDYKKWQKAHQEVISAGGLHVIGTERHESRRIDNQLRGRSGRQGDPGSSKFYLSLEDDLMRIFGGEQISNLMDRLKLPEDQSIENKLISRAIEQAQVKVEGFHFDARKRVVEYDDIANQQRDIIYTLRKRILESDDISAEIYEKLEAQINNVVLSSVSEKEKIDAEMVVAGLVDIIPFDDNSIKEVKKAIEKIETSQKLTEFLNKALKDTHSTRQKQVGEKVMREIEKYAYLGSIDTKWIEHLDEMENLREGVGIRGNNDNERLVIYKTESYDLFETLIDRINAEMARRIFRIGVSQARESEIPLDLATTNIDQSDSMGLANPDEAKPVTKQRINKTKIGRNDPCWCNSGKKWKKCHFPHLPQ
ncbi:MAG: SEC-C metal-binding domain-containing protein, partial [Patescibacteria group bacterium]